MLTIYNTISRKKEALKPFDNTQSKKLKLFVCGPTVYDFSHLGHARTYAAFDMIVKYLRQKGYEVFYLQNITDIDDKIINRAKEKNVLPKDLARQFEKEYLADMSALKINSVTKYARATEYIPEIISQVERLLKKGFAYKTEDGIYYDISKFKNYGKLSNRKSEGAEDAVSRIDQSIAKKNKGDFCLWKLSRSGEPSWSGPFGKGRPGWHIEDTAITEKYFGAQYDIHGGARDLIFPHHEAEIAQMEAISGKSPLVFHWLHTGFLTISGQKMSKSLGNFITIKDFLKIHSARILRLFALKSHYRSPIDYSEKEIDAAKNQLERIDEFINKLRLLIKTNKNSQIFANKINDYSRKFEKAMEDDFNTPKAIAAIFDLINKSNSLIDKGKLTLSDAENILKFFEKIDSFFGFIFPEKTENIPKEVKVLTEEREKFRQEKNWQKSDQVRKKIKSLGYEVKDTPSGPELKKI
ncbi:MAG: cysteine--tRNA ligase [Parcubacteria group bacterium]